MDDHMLDRLENEIRLCFMCAEMELRQGEDIKDHYQYKAADVLINAYNALVKLYYKPEYIESSLKHSVTAEYRNYLSNK